MIARLIVREIHILSADVSTAVAPHAQGFLLVDIRVGDNRYWDARVDFKQVTGTLTLERAYETYAPRNYAGPRLAATSLQKACEDTLTAAVEFWHGDATRGPRVVGFRKVVLFPESDAEREIDLADETEVW
jgi:hypothetical protein